MACWTKKPHIDRWIPKEPSETAEFHAVWFQNEDWYYIDSLDVLKIRDLINFTGHGILDVTAYEQRHNMSARQLFPDVIAGFSECMLSISVGAIYRIGMKRSGLVVVENSEYNKNLTKNH